MTSEHSISSEVNSPDAAETQPTPERPIDAFKQYLLKAIQSEDKLVPDELLTAMVAMLIRKVPGPNAPEQFNANVYMLRGMVEDEIADLSTDLSEAQKYKLCNRVMDAVIVSLAMKVSIADSLIQIMVDQANQANDLLGEVRAGINRVLPEGS